MAKKKVPEEEVEVQYHTLPDEETLNRVLAGGDGDMGFVEPYHPEEYIPKHRGDAVSAKHAMDLMVNTPNEKLSRITSTPRRSFFTLVANETFDDISLGKVNFITGKTVSQCLREARDNRAMSLADDKGQGWLPAALLNLGMTVTEGEEEGRGSFI